MYKREILGEISNQLKKGKSVLLLGPRQVGKTTLSHQLDFRLSINLALNKERQLYERDPNLLSQKILSLNHKRPLVYIDEVQKVPALLDEVQALIDQKKATFLLTGSSARKLRSESKTNLIPGRVVNLRMDPLSIDENPASIEEIFAYGQLPEIAQTKETKQKSLLLRSYVENYIEDEIRKETKIRNVANYSRFLELAAIQSGRITNFTEISKELGPTVATIQSYYQILEDTLLAERIDPYLKNSSRKKLTKSSKYLFFDLGVRRISAKEGISFLPERRGELFEHLVGNEILKWIHSRVNGARLYFWRDADGPEVDWLIEYEDRLLPIEVKLSPSYKPSHAKHLKTFLSEYPNAKTGVVINNSDLNFKDAEINVVGFAHLTSFLDKWTKG